MLHGNPKGSPARYRPFFLGPAHMQRISHQVAFRRLASYSRQFLRIARQQRSERRMHFHPCASQGCNRRQALRQRLAMRLIQAPGGLVIGRQRKTHTSLQLGQQLHIANTQRRPRLQHKPRRRICDQRSQNSRHVGILRLRGLIRIHQGRTINHLRWTQSPRQQFRGILFECCELSPSFPVFRFQAAIQAHRGDITVRAAIGAIARRRQ